MVGRIGRIVATAGAVAAAMVDVVHPRKEEMVRRREKTVINIMEYHE
jgi:hypothetical protein